MDEEIYGRTGRGTAFTLARYSSGSAADPRGREPDWNRTVELVPEDPKGGVLLLHGMSDSPYSFRAFAEELHRRGRMVVALRLPGHGTIPSGLRAVKWEEMASAVRLAMGHLASKVGERPIHVMGYSTGAPLALDYTLDAMEGKVSPAPAGLVLVSPAIAVTPLAVLAVWKDRLAHIPGLGKFAWNSIIPEFDPYKYNSFAVNAGVQVHRLTRTLAGRLTALSEEGPIGDFPPTLVFLSTVDATVSADAVVSGLMGKLAPGRHELVLFDINRRNVDSTILVSDPGPLTRRLMDNGNLPFHLSLVANADPDSREVVWTRKAPLSRDPVTEELAARWPRNVFSLSHVALPAPPAGRRPRG